MSEFDRYVSDQFPLREQFRTGKAMNEFFIFRKNENSGICFHNGYAAKVEYPLNENSVSYACRRFSYINEKYLENTDVNIYYSVIPDKNYFISQVKNTPSLNYSQLLNIMKDGMKFAEYIDIFPSLELSDYYRTDTHWKQECIQDTACMLAEGMNITTDASYTQRTVDKPFYGVYCGQAALPAEPEHITLLENEIINSFRVTDHETETTPDIYDMTRAEGNDLYEIYLSGPKSLMTIENPSVQNGRKLVVFRDSFGSSIAPLLAQGYEEVTLVDIRYLHPDILSRFIKFDNQDVLFLYSTLVLNNSESVK